LGGLVSFSKKEGSCGPFSPLTKAGNISGSFSLFSACGDYLIALSS